MKKAVFLTIVLLFQLATAIAWGAESQILTVEEPPSSYRSATGELQGLAIDIVRAIQERIGNHDPVQIVPEVRALKIAAESSNVVLVGFSRIPEREQHFNWILRYLRKPWVLYARTGESFAIHSLEDA
jgi:polar amino acid transport system substrate-binding protein